MKSIKYFVFTLLAVLVLSSCGTTQTVPVTGRQHRISVSDEQVLSLSRQEYTKYMASAKKSTDVQATQMVQRVGRRLANAVETYLRNNGFQSELKNFQWEFNLVQDKSANAFCMPGGKIVVYDGLFPYTKNETGLAIVLGHEIAHAVAKHSAEQLTKKQNQGALTSIGGAVLNGVVGSGVGDIASQVASGVFSFRNLKYSRDNETEADYMGLIFAAMAGYDPQNAVSFWQRMSAGSGGKTSDFMSDHPSDAKRIANIRGWLPEAEKYYAASGAKTVTTTAKRPAPTRKATRKRR